MEATNQNFLRSPSNQTERAGNSSVKKSKMLEIAQTIAKVDDLVQAIHKNECHNTKLQQQLKDFQATAQQVQQLYNKEKNDHSKAKNDLEQLQKEYSKIDVNLTNVSMVNEQLKARLAEYDGRPINFDNLVVKYVKIVNKLEGHDILSYYPDKDLVQRLREYCGTKKLKIPKANISPKKTRSRIKKPKTEERSVQCDLLEDALSAKHDCPTCKSKNKVQDQSTQCSVKKREQASQYISTMITRQTNTEKLVQKHVQTMFPEAPIAIDDVHGILNLFTEWSNIRSVSPLRESPTPKINKTSKDILKKFSTTGTCTMLCNIRRKIDYLPLNNSSKIKQEIFTPSVSPTPASYPISRPRLGSLSNNLPNNISSSSLLNLFNSTTNSSLGQLSPSAFNELWQIFGKMLLSLLQTNNTGNASANQNTPLNQQQFLDWLLELYTNSQPQNTTTAETQTLEQMASNVSRSPLFFNDASLLSADIMRPQPQRILLEENVVRSNMREDEANLSLSANLIDNNSNSQIYIADTSNSPVKINQRDCDSMMREIHQRQNISNTDELHITNIFEPNLHKLSQNTNIEEGEKATEKTKIKDNILDQIQKFLPDINLSKKKRKAMKRLLKSKNHRKKSFEIRKSKTGNDNNNCDTVETAVDFLKTFAVTQKIDQPIEEDMSETEKIFLQQISGKNMPDNVPNILISEKFNISNPITNFKQTEPTLKSENSKAYQQMAKKYELLFGESDSELGDQEIESSTFNPKHVIKSTAELTNCHSKCDFQSLKSKIKNDNLTMFSPNQNCTNQRSNNTISLVENKLNQISINDPIRNTPHEQFPSVNMNTPIFNNSCNLIATQDTTVTITNLPTPILKDVEFTYLPDVLHSINSQDTRYFGLNSNKESLNSINESNSFSFSNIGNSVENDLELSSDEDVEDVVEKPKSSKEAATIEEIIYININNCNEEINQKTENVQSQEIITLQGSLNETNKPTAENSIKYQKNLNKYDSSENSHQIINFTRLDSMDNVSENYSSDDSMDNHQIINSSMLPPYSSDIEKDFELSSDNESHASESNVNDIQEFSSRTFEESKDIELSEERVNSFDNFTDHFELKSGKDYKLNNFKENVNISPSNFSKYENQPESNGSNAISVVRAGKENIFKTIKNSTNPIDTEAGDFVSLRKEENLNKFLLSNNDENIFKSNFEVNNNTKQIKEDKQQIRNLESNKYNSCNNYNENPVELKQQIESEDELQSEQIPAKPRNKEESENESIIQSESEKTSFVWSVITVSNATLQSETLNINEINQEFNEINEDKDIHKVSSLRTLRLVGLNKMHTNAYNAKALRAANDSQDNSNKYQFVEPENNMNPLDDEEAVPTIAKPNITKVDQEEKVTILSSSLLKAANYIEDTSVDHQNYLNEGNNSCSHEMLTLKTLGNCDVSNVESMPNNINKIFNKNTNEINQKFNEINEDKDIPKVSSLRTLRIVGFNKMHTNAYNAKAIREANNSQGNSNKYQFIKPENNINPPDDEEAVPTIAKPNITKIDQEEKVTIPSSSLLKAANYIEDTSVDHQNYLNEGNNSCSHEMLTLKNLRNCNVSKVESMPNNINKIFNKNINEINQEFNEINEDKDIPKVSSLRTLRIVGLNKMHTNAYNAKAIRAANHSQENSNKYQFIKPENNMNPPDDEEAVPTIAKPNITKTDQEEKVTILSSSLLKAANYIEDTSVDHQNYLNEGKNSCSHEMLTVQTLENCDASMVESMPNNVSNSCKYKVVVDDIDFNDNLSVEDELVIDEELKDSNNAKESNDEYNNNSIPLESDQSYNDTTNSSISTLLNSTIYNEVLTESFQPIVNDLLEEEMITTPELKQKRGRKRKNECLTELQPRKCSQRLKAKRVILEESLNFNQTTIELGKYTKRQKNSTNNVQTKSPVKDDIEKEYETEENCDLPENENSLHLGFFRERMTEEDATISNSRAIMVAKSRKPILSNEKVFTTSCEGDKIDRPEQQNHFFLESENLNDITAIESEPEEKPKDFLEPFEIFIYSESPQSPISSTTNSVESSETCVIPLERPPQFVLQDNHLTLFDVLIKSYRIENHKHILESAIARADKRKQSILNRCCEEIRSYCYNEMELDLYCTSARAINKILSISPDYDLIQRALITVAQHAEGTNTPENELPSIIQEMPPRHMPKCLQRLFVFLQNLLTRNENFCQDLIKKIELLLFNFKQTEHLSLQATLNLTQLYLMASKVQENLQSARHSARLFIAKTLYFYFQKAILMVHEVLMWFPTVLPHREDKTYDRSDALISVIQYALMSTKYEMKDKPDLRGKILLSKLRYEYHFEPFKPTTDEIINVLVEKLKNSKFYNISLAFGLLCKRIGVLKVEQYILNQCLLPLANEYYSLALKTNDYDKRIAVLLEVISMLVKPLPIQTDTQKYFNEFSRFLNGFERQIIQEAALCSLLRLQRFDAKCCYDLIRHFQPTYNLKTHTETMLKTFLYRRPLTYWKNLQSQS